MASELSKFIDDELQRNGSAPGSAKHANPKSGGRLGTKASSGLTGELSSLIDEELARSSHLESDSLLKPKDRKHQPLGREAREQVEGHSGSRCCSPRMMLLMLLAFGILMLTIVFISGHAGGKDYAYDDSGEAGVSGPKRRPAGVVDPGNMFDFSDEDFSDLYDEYEEYGGEGYGDDEDGYDAGSEYDMEGATYYADDYEDGELDGQDEYDEGDYEGR